MRIDLEALAVARAEEQVQALAVKHAEVDHDPNLCAAPGCDRPRRKGRGRYCYAHERRKERGQDMNRPVRAYRIEAWARVVQWATQLGLAEGDEEYARAEANLRESIRAWVEKGGTRPHSLNVSEAA